MLYGWANTGFHKPRNNFLGTNGVPEPAAHSTQDARLGVLADSKSAPAVCLGSCVAIREQHSELCSRSRVHPVSSTQSISARRRRPAACRYRWTLGAPFLFELRYASIKENVLVGGQVSSPITPTGAASRSGRAHCVCVVTYAVYQ